MGYKIIQLWARGDRYTHGGNSRKYIVVHNTGNTATAEQEAKNLHNNPGQASFQYTLDDKDIYQCVHDYDTAWAVGKWAGTTAYIRNNESISIEVCNPGTKFTDAEIDRLHWLVRDLMEYYNIPASNVVRHWDCHSGRKACPAYYAGANNKAWNSLHALITSPYEKEQKKMSDAKINAIPNQTYTGKEIKPNFTVTNGATFTKSYENNVNVGHGIAKATGTGDWTGTISATFNILPKSLVNYTDVDPTAWYVDTLSRAVEAGYISGYNEHTIDPYGTLTRGQACCLFANMEGADLDSAFSDVVASPYYYEAVNWAEEKGIVSGDGGEFRPDDPCSRQEFCCMIHNLAGNPKPKKATFDYDDWSNVADWAKDAVAWCIENNIVSGSSGKIRPTDKCLRCEAAAILVNYKM